MDRVRHNKGMKGWALEKWVAAGLVGGYVWSQVGSGTTAQYSSPFPPQPGTDQVQQLEWAVGHGAKLLMPPPGHEDGV